MKIVCIVPARNEERHLGKVLRAVDTQVDYSIVVDDGSTDKTRRIAQDCGATVVDGPDHKYQARTLRICETINRGLSNVPRDTEYVLILGADDVIPSNYCQALTRRMEKNPKLVIASGRVDKTEVNIRLPRGSGRLVDYQWWIRSGRPRGYYNISLAWESELVMWAWWMGYQACQFPDIVIHAQRPPGTQINWSERGAGMRLLGYTFPQVIWRGLKMTLFGQNLKGGWDMTISYLASDLRPEPWVRSLQKRWILEGLKRRVMIGRRSIPKGG